MKPTRNRKARSVKAAISHAGRDNNVAQIRKSWLPQLSTSIHVRITQRRDGNSPPLLSYLLKSTLLLAVRAVHVIRRSIVFDERSGRANARRRTTYGPDLVLPGGHADEFASRVA